MNSEIGGQSDSYDRTRAIIREARVCLLAGARIKDSADPSDALLVLLSGPLSELHGQLFNSGQLSELLKKSFGWEMSSDAIDFFVPKMRQLGWLEARDQLTAKGILYVNLPEPEVDGSAGMDTREALETLGSEFQSFAQNLSPFQTLSKDPIEAGATLLKHVVDANLPISASEKRARTDEAFLAARFVEEVNAKKLPARDVLAGLAAVGFLFEVAEEIAHPSKRRRLDLRIIIDAPILLDHLGCSGKLRADASKEIFDQLRSMGATTATFEHCVDEAREALRSVLRKTPRDRFGPTGEALRKGWVNENALLGLLQSFEIAVRQAKIDILPGDPQFAPNSVKFFSEELAADVDKIINWHDEDKTEAKYADSDTTVLTIRRRAGYRTNDLFTSKYVCVTTNPTFAGATRRHLLEISYYNSRQAPPVITLKELAARLWLEVGSTDSALRLTLPNSQLLLSCERALRFNRRVVENARAELAKVKPDQLAQFELLLEVPRSARAVMDMTLNNERYVTGNTIDQLVEAAVDAAGEAVAAKAQQQRARDHTRFQKEMDRVDAELVAEKQRADANETQAELARQQIERADAAMLEAVGDLATSRFARWRLIIRALSCIVAIVPLVTLVGLSFAGQIGVVGILIGLVTAALAAAVAMDRPGAWLSHLIQRWIEESAEKSLRSLGRYDLAEQLLLVWSNNVATAQFTGPGADSD